MIRNSIFSDCGKFRYQLIRIWDENKRLAMCIGLNPSNAGQLYDDGKEKDDPTIRMLQGTLETLDFGGFYMVNLYALVSPTPAVLFSVSDAQGQNSEWIANAALNTQAQVFCWGAFKGIEYRAKKMINTFPDGLCFGKNADGSPWHPRAMSYIKDFRYDQAQLLKFKK